MANDEYIYLITCPLCGHVARSARALQAQLRRIEQQVRHYTTRTLNCRANKQLDKARRYKEHEYKWRRREARMLQIMATEATNG